MSNQKRTLAFGLAAALLLTGIPAVQASGTVVYNENKAQQFTHRDSPNVPQHADGTFKWLPAVNETGVDGYDVYFLNAEGQKLGDKLFRTLPSQIGANGTYEVTLQNAVPIPAGAVKFGIYTVRGGVEYPVPTTCLLFDNPGYQIYQMQFVDTDPDAGEIGGPFTWADPQNQLNLAGYDVYLYDTPQGRIKLGEVDLAARSFTVPPNTPRGGKITLVPRSIEGVLLDYLESRGTHILDKTPQDLTVKYQTSMAPYVEYGSLQDQNATPNVLGGILQFGAYWTKPVAGYNYHVYFANDNNKRLYKLGESVSGFREIQLAPTEIPAGATKLLVTMSNGSWESEFPQEIKIWDKGSYMPTHVQFVDNDPDPNGLSGTITWTAAQNLTPVYDYRIKVYGGPSWQSQLIAHVPKTATSYTFPAGFKLDFPADYISFEAMGDPWYSTYGPETLWHKLSAD